MARHNRACDRLTKTLSTFSNHGKHVTEMSCASISFAELGYGGMKLAYGYTYVSPAKTLLTGNRSIARSTYSPIFLLFNRDHDDTR